MRNYVPTRLARRASKVQGRRPRSHEALQPGLSEKINPPLSSEWTSALGPATSGPARERDLTEFPILQFGASRFLQAHVDLFVSEALPRGEAMGRIAVAGTTGSPESRRRIAAFAAGRPYPVLVKGLSEGAIVDERVEVQSVGSGVDAGAWAGMLGGAGIAARAADDLGAALSDLDRHLEPGDVLLTLGSGDVGTIADAFLRRLPHDRQGR